MKFKKVPKRKTRALNWNPVSTALKLWKNWTWPRSKLLIICICVILRAFSSHIFHFILNEFYELCLGFMAIRVFCIHVHNTRKKWFECIIWPTRNCTKAFFFSCNMRHHYWIPLRDTMKYHFGMKKEGAAINCLRGASLCLSGLKGEGKQRTSKKTN